MIFLLGSSNELTISPGPRQHFGLSLLRDEVPNMTVPVVDHLLGIPLHHTPRPRIRNSDSSRSGCASAGAAALSTSSSPIVVVVTVIGSIVGRIRAPRPTLLALSNLPPSSVLLTKDEAASVGREEGHIFVLAVVHAIESGHPTILFHLAVVIGPKEYGQ